MKKALYSTLSLAALIHFISCSSGSEQTTSDPKADSIRVSQIEAEKASSSEAAIVVIGGNEFPAVALNPTEIKKALIAGHIWMGFGTFPGNDADSAILARYEAHREKMYKNRGEMLGDTLKFSEPNVFSHKTEFEPRTKSLVGEDLPVWERGKDSKKIREGTFEITEQNTIVTNVGARANLNDERLTIAVLTKNELFILDTFEFENVKFPVYKRFLKTE